MQHDPTYYAEGFRKLMTEKMEDHDWKSAGCADVTMRVAISGAVIRGIFRLFAENADLRERIAALEAKVNPAAPKDFRRVQNGVTEHANVVR